MTQTNYIQVVLAFVLIAVSSSGCKYFKKDPIFENDIDTVLNADIPAPDTLDPEPIAPPVYEDGHVYTLDEIPEPYIMVIGSFETLKFAEKHAENFEKIGYDTKVIVKPDGFHMVAADYYNQKDEAFDALPTFRDKVAVKSWVYVNEKRN